jgi:Gluconate 2-dehydrogenase subunit 3
MDRRTTVKWILAVSASWPAWQRAAGQATTASVAVAAQGAGNGQGYGTDPNLLKVYRPGDVWPLTLTAAQRRLAGVLADLIIPADEHSPSASAVGVVDFIDEWVSAPYPENQGDRPIVLKGFTWLDAEAGRRFGRNFADLDAAGHRSICDRVCDAARAAAAEREAAQFFALFRDLTAGAFYTSPVGRKDLQYIGNVPRAHFDGPPEELLKRLNLL